jgi:hypothetical protein
MDDRSSQLVLIAASSGLMVPFAKGASQAAQKRAADRLRFCSPTQRLMAQGRDSDRRARLALPHPRP